MTTRITDPYHHPIPPIEVNLIDLRDTLFNITPLAEDRCIVNFRGRVITGQQVEPKAPLILECSLEYIVSLINELGDKK